MDIKERIDLIISELKFLKANYLKEQAITEFCRDFRIALISKLEQTGAIYDPTLEYELNATGNNTTDKKKFFAFKKSDSSTEVEFLTNLRRMYEVVIEYMSQFGGLKNLYFNIQQIEGLRDRDAFSDLIRGILVVKEVNNAR